MPASRPLVDPIQMFIIGRRRFFLLKVVEHSALGTSDSVAGDSALIVSEGQA